MKGIFVVFALISIFGSLFFLFKKANRKGWEALIPVYNLYVWLQILKKPWWWIFLFIFPGVNILMLMVLCVSTAHVFGYRNWQHVTLSAFLPFLFLPFLLREKHLKYQPINEKKKQKKSAIIEWRDAIVFAIVAASIIRTYFLEAYTIPTSSMEKSMLIGDYLFVSKMSYGPKVPQTPLSFPFAHHTLPFTENIQSYLEWWKLPFFRIPGYSEVKRNDVVVFNFPAGDTVVVAQQNETYEQIIRDYAFQLQQNDYVQGKPQKDKSFYRNSAREALWRRQDITIRPVDKRENYIKRCVAVPGDELQIKNGVLFINNEQAEIPEEFQYNYILKTKDLINKARLKSDYNINYQDQRRIKGGNGYIVPLTFGNYQKIKESSLVENIIPALHFDQIKNYKHWSTPYLVEVDPIYYSEYRGALNRIFPNSDLYNWNVDNFGPITIPKKGETVELNLYNLPLYKRIIGVYEGNDLQINGEEILINGVSATSYTFKMNYYWMMGDNRHNSQDSRFWGFVPEDHIVGEAAFIWLSIDPELTWFNGKIRWNRIFSGIQ